MFLFSIPPLFRHVLLVAWLKRAKSEDALRRRPMRQVRRDRPPRLESPLEKQSPPISLGVHASSSSSSSFRRIAIVRLTRVPFPSDHAALYGVGRTVVPQEEVDVEEVKKVFPYGQVLPVEFQRGGMRASSGIELPEMGGEIERNPLSSRRTCQANSGSLDNRYGSAGWAI